MSVNGSQCAPSAVYEEFLARRREDLALISKRELIVSVSRLVVACAGLVLLWLAIQSRVLSPWWIVVPVVIFAALMVIHDGCLRRRQRLERAVAYYERGLARLSDEWVGTGETGETFADADHPYASDLDLFGRGSLFELISVARTCQGENELASWLLSPAEPEEIRSRQAAVSELRQELDLRELLATLGDDVRSDLDEARLVSWCAAPRPLARWSWLPAVLLVLGIANVGALVAWLSGSLDVRLMLAIFSIGTLVFLVVRNEVAKVLEGVDKTHRDLELLSQLLLCVEGRSFDCDWLAARTQRLETHGVSAGAALRRLRKLADYAESRKNAFFAPLGATVFWSTQTAFAIERWRGDYGSSIETWFRVIGDVEAACSLATYSYERPEEPFPKIVDGTTRLVGRAVGHPLLPSSTCVRNDVGLGVDGLQGLIISGSNMSGKSTYLRTCGCNAVLALAGGVVRAESLELTPLQVGAAMRVQDSLQDGSSKFYAEIKRLRLLLDLTKQPLPVLFLLDEILHGTNSHDRRIGAEAIVKAFVDSSSIGLVTTHDLALASIAQEAEGELENVHFVDHLEDGRIHFDYRLHHGVVARSNALALMREVGLEV